LGHLRNNCIRSCAAIDCKDAAMVTVKLGGPLQSQAGGAKVFEVEAANIRELLERLGEMYPELRPMLDRGVTVAVNGTIFRGAFLAPVPAGSEVYLLPALVGG
jgi:sulfur-carrier protein